MWSQGAIAPVHFRHEKTFPDQVNYLKIRYDFGIAFGLKLTPASKVKELASNSNDLNSCDHVILNRDHKMNEVNLSAFQIKLN